MRKATYFFQLPPRSGSEIHHFWWLRASGFCHTGNHTENNCQLKSFEMSFALSLFLDYRIVFQFCTENGIDTDVLRTKSPEDWATTTNVIDARVCVRFEFNAREGYLSLQQSADFHNKQWDVITYIDRIAAVSDLDFVKAHVTRQCNAWCEEGVHRMHCNQWKLKIKTCCSDEDVSLFMINDNTTKVIESYLCSIFVLSRIQWNRN